MKIKTSELIGPALNWAVAKCIWPNRIGNMVPLHYDGSDYAPSRKWAHGGMIIEREGISIEPFSGEWMARIYNKDNVEHNQFYIAPAPLIAAMRCYVASKLGDEVEVPEELQ